MNRHQCLLLLVLLAPFFQTIAAECDPNGVGGTFCVNDDGTTTDTMPNEVNGTDTYSGDGKLTSSPEQMGDTDAGDDSASATSGQPDAALEGRDWNAPSNINEGGATSSMDILDKP